MANKYSKMELTKLAIPKLFIILSNAIFSHKEDKAKNVNLCCIIFKNKLYEVLNFMNEEK